MWVRQGSPPHMNRTRETPMLALPPATRPLPSGRRPHSGHDLAVALGESPTFSGPYFLTCAQEFGQGHVNEFDFPFPSFASQEFEGTWRWRTGLKPHYVERECNWKLGRRREGMTVARALLRGTRPHTHRSLARALAGRRWRRRTTLSVEIRNACTILGKSLDLSELPLPGL